MRDCTIIGPNTRIRVDCLSVEVEANGVLGISARKCHRQGCRQKLYETAALIRALSTQEVVSALLELLSVAARRIIVVSGTE